MRQRPSPPQPPGLRQWCEHLLQLRRRRLAAQALPELYTGVLEPGISAAGLRWDWNGNVRHNPWVEGIEVVLPLREGHGEAEPD